MTPRIQRVCIPFAVRKSDPVKSESKAPFGKYRKAALASLKERGGCLTACNAYHTLKDFKIFNQLGKCDPWFTPDVDSHRYGRAASGLRPEMCSVFCAGLLDSQDQQGAAVIKELSQD